MYLTIVHTYFLQSVCTQKNFFAPSGE